VKFCYEHVRVAVALALLVLAICALSLRSGVCFASGGDEALLPMLADADAALKRAFVAVSDADAAGANVSGLLDELDVAGKSLTMAEMAYAAGNSSEAATMVGQCVAWANAVAGEAANVKSQAVADARAVQWRAILFSSVGTFVFLIMLVLIWVLFRRSYGARLLGAKPEVAG
jgi:hypothetical protein